MSDAVSASHLDGSIWVRRTRTQRRFEVARSLASAAAAERQQLTPVLRGCAVCYRSSDASTECLIFPVILIRQSLKLAYRRDCSLPDAGEQTTCQNYHRYWLCDICDVTKLTVSLAISIDNIHTCQSASATIMPLVSMTPPIFN